MAALRGLARLLARPRCGAGHGCGPAAAAAATRGISGAEGHLQSHLETRLHRLKRGDDRNDEYRVERMDFNRQTMIWEPIGEEQKRIIRSLRRNITDLDWEGALVVLDTIPPSPGNEWNPVFRAVLQCCCKALRPEEARMVFDRIPRRDVMAYNMLMNMYCHLQQIDEIHRLRGQMDEDGIKPSAVTHVTMLKAWSQLGMVEEADRGLQALKADPELQQDVNWEVAYLNALNACGRAGQPQKAREMFDDFAARPGVQAHHSHYNALLGAYKNDPVGARAVFEEMRRAGLAPRVRDWRTLMVCNRGSWESVTRLYAEMQQELGQVADEDVFALLLNLARGDGNAEGVRWTREEMARVGVDAERPSTLPALRQALLASERLLDQPAMRPAWGSEASGASASPPPLPPPTAPLPEGWASAVDPASGRTYYWQAANPAASTTWERPGFGASAA